MANFTGGSPKADHLCVLAHGLWGTPEHMNSIAKALRAKHNSDIVNILIPKRNSGNFTYDGVELGGERMCMEIEEELKAVEARGGKITKLSFVGYSLGGVVARYAIGLLYSRGILQRVQCMNFTAFASPFLGVRAPVDSWTTNIWNIIGARTLSTSGRQLFTIDSFRDTGRPLFSVLTDTNSVFMKGLSMFPNRTLYANIANDKSAPYYTTFITKTDPYIDMDKVKVNCVDGYDDVILDRDHPVDVTPPQALVQASTSQVVASWLNRIPVVAAIVVFVPIGVSAYLINALIQTVRSSQRIALHEKGQAGINIADYRTPGFLDEIRGTVEDAFENLNSSQKPQFLRATDNGVDDDHHLAYSSTASGDDSDGVLVGPPHTAQGLDARQDQKILARERRLSDASSPTLALSPQQFQMIDALNSLGWKKYPVWIKHRRSHAAIVLRQDKASWYEGKAVLRHWVNEEFLI